MLFLRRGKLIPAGVKDAAEKVNEVSKGRRRAPNEYSFAGSPILAIRG
jgi:hypothetical protein